MMIVVEAPAKVNLNLHVIGRRQDGFHEVITRMQKLDLCDSIQLELTTSEGVEISVTGEDAPSNAANLAVKAAHNFFSHYNPPSRCGLKIKLVKRIPVAAGLGGGSSDGGAVLKGLNQLFDYPFSESELIKIGSGLGADFAFFISDRTAVEARGIGDKLVAKENVDCYSYLLVNPGIKVETKWVYSNYRLTKNCEKFILTGFQNSEDQGFSINDLHNDLEQVTIGRHPVIARLKKRLLENGAAGALMSGSGPTVFGLFEQPGRIAAALESLEKEFASKAGFKLLSAKAYGGA